MAIFHRHSDLNEYVFPGIEGLFNIVTTHEYPYHVDNRSDEQKILDDTIYFIRSYSMYRLEFSDEVPLKKLLDPLRKYYVTVDSLKELLEQNDWTVVDREDGPVVLIPEPSVSENSSDRDNWDDLDSDWNDHEVVEDNWDADPGPPAHYSSEQLVDMVIQRENWDEEPSIPVDSIVQEEASSLSTEVSIFVSSEENTQRHGHDNEIQDSTSILDIEESIEMKDEIQEFRGPSTSACVDLPAQSECAANAVTGTEPLTFSFKEVLNYKTELHSQKFSETDFEFHLSNNRPKSNSSNGNSPRKTHRKAQKKATISRRGVFDELGSLCSIYLEPSQNENSKTCFEDLSNRSFESTISATSSTNDSKVYENLVSSNDLNICAKKLRVDDSSSSFSSSTFNTPPKFTSSPRTSAELKRKYSRHQHLKRGKEILNEAEMWEGNLIE